MWTGKSDDEHIEIVARYLVPGGFSKENLQAYALSKSTHSDPLFIVSAKK